MNIAKLPQLLRKALMRSFGTLFSPERPRVSIPALKAVSDYG